MTGVIQNHKGTVLLLGEMEGDLRVCQVREERGGEKEKERERKKKCPVFLPGYVWVG